MAVTKVQKEVIERINSDPVLWAKAHIITYDNVLKRYVPWTARWYQAEMLRDKSRKKVYRCGRRTGKTETMCVEALYNVNTKVEYVVVIACPYETQVRLIFGRLMELVNGSPLLLRKLVNSTKNPFEIRFRNNSRIVGFTMGSSSNSGGASLRGQRASMIIVDEMDYLAENDFENISMLAAEREDIGIVVSSTPTGRHSDFYKICTEKSIGYSEHFHPSHHNPNWNEKMEAEFRSQLTELGYIHEVLAEFGPQDTGVFNKELVALARNIENYAYQELDSVMLHQIELSGGEMPVMYLPLNGKFKPNIFRTMGVDWDKYGASSSIIILDYDIDREKFRVIRRIEVPKSEYSYDNAVNLIVELNNIYNPSWIYVDRGAGEYQIERLHIIGEQKPASGLKNKVKGFQFKNKIEVPDPVKKTVTDEPMKPFMVNQLVMAFERRRMILSPYDDVLYKQLIDYSVERISQAGLPVYTSKNEHFIDALGLSYLAFVLEFPMIANGIKEIENTSRIKFVQGGFQGVKAQRDLAEIALKAAKNNPWNKTDPTELRGDRPSYYKVPMGTPLGFYKGGSSSIGWGSRGGRSSNSFRSSW